MSETIPDDVIAEANENFEQYLKNVQSRSEDVVVLRGPYHEGLSTVRALLKVGGHERRVFYRVADKRWRSA